MFGCRESISRSCKYGISCIGAGINHLFFGCTWSVILHSDCHFYPSTHSVFDHFQYAKTEGEGLGNFITWSTARPSNVITRPLNSQVIYSDLAFCASYKDGTSASRELH